MSRNFMLLREEMIILGVLTVRVASCSVGKLTRLIHRRGYFNLFLRPATCLSGIYNKFSLQKREKLFRAVRVMKASHKVCGISEIKY